MHFNTTFQCNIINDDADDDDDDDDDGDDDDEHQIINQKEFDFLHNLKMKAKVKK